MKNKLISIFLAIAVVSVATFGFLYAFKGDTVKNEEPPSLVSNTVLQGLLKTGKYEFATWDDDDEEAFENNKKKFEDDDEDATKLYGGVNYVYAKEDLSYKAVFQRIDSMGKQAAVATYKDGKFRIYPKTTYYDAKATVEVKTSEIIPAYTGIVVVLAENAYSYGLYKSDTKPEKTLNSCSYEEGWNLIAVNKKKLDDIFKNCSKNIDYIYSQKNDTAFEKKVYSSTSQNWSDVKDLELGKYLIWVKFDEKPILSDDDMMTNEFTLSATTKDKKVILNWPYSDNSKSEKTFKIFYKADGEFRLIEDKQTNILNYSLQNPTANTVKEEFTATINGLDEGDHVFMVEGYDKNGIKYSTGKLNYKVKYLSNVNITVSEKGNIVLADNLMVVPVNHFSIENKLDKDISFEKFVVKIDGDFTPDAKSFITEGKFSFHNSFQKGISVDSKYKNIIFDLNKNSTSTGLGPISIGKNSQKILSIGTFLFSSGNINSTNFKYCIEKAEYRVNNELKSLTDIGCFTNHNLNEEKTAGIDNIAVIKEVNTIYKDKLFNLAIQINPVHKDKIKNEPALLATLVDSNKNIVWETMIKGYKYDVEKNLITYAEIVSNFDKKKNHILLLSFTDTEKYNLPFTKVIPAINVIQPLDKNQFDFGKLGDLPSGTGPKLEILPKSDLGNLIIEKPLFPTQEESRPAEDEGNKSNTRL